MIVDGHPVTTVSRTLVDLARTVGQIEAVVAIDAALRLELVDADDLAAQVAGCRSWPNIRRAAQVINLADGRSESPLESVSRLVFARAGLPAPQLQAVMRDPRTGRFLGRCDFYWDEYGVFGEADGRAKYDSRDVLFAEKQRQEDLEATGLIGVRWGWREVRGGGGAAATTRLRVAFDRGMRRDATFPRAWSVAVR